jgi:hypothetical protein
VTLMTPGYQQRPNLLFKKFGSFRLRRIRLCRRFDRDNTHGQHAKEKQLIPLPEEAAPMEYWRYLTFACQGSFPSTRLETRQQRFVGTQ